jgi:twitching motility protein PilT
MKKNRGIFIIAGERRQGKTSLLHEIIYNEQMSHVNIIGMHSSVQNQDWIDVDSVMQLGADTVDFDSNHILYEGVEKIVVDMNSVKNWKKWIEMAEQGQGVLLTLSTNSVKTVLNRIFSELDRQTSFRLMNVLSGIIAQKLVGNNLVPCSEILVIKEKQREILRQQIISELGFLSTNLGQEFKDSYQSLNQSLIQKLIRRKIDVQSAFESSDDPEILDQMLKKMGL